MDSDALVSLRFRFDGEPMTRHKWLCGVCAELLLAFTRGGLVVTSGREEND